MRKLITLLLVCFVFLFGCKNPKESEDIDAVEQTRSASINEKDIAQLKYTDYILDQKAENLIKKSGEYTQLQDLKNNIKKGDLSLFGEDNETSKELFKNLRQTLPSELNTESVLARILVLETSFYKLESLSNLPTTTKAERLNAIKGFLVAFSNLNLQMNKKVEFDNRTIEKPE
ncbi:hypothetical protein GSB9_02604 [Flavobacteriaceae bacterium GSB9]|nr:hypothetical protein GSB9_02604 [Flavobacteriaceae bacterium GSB9]